MHSMASFSNKSGRVHGHFTLSCVTSRASVKYGCSEEARKIVGICRLGMVLPRFHKICGKVRRPHWAPLKVWLRCCCTGNLEGGPPSLDRVPALLGTSWKF